MAELKFDHTKDSDFLEAIGMSKQDGKDLNKKFAEISQFIIIKTPRKSELIEKVAETFSYNELVIAATYFLINKTTEVLKQNPMLAILGLLSEKEE
jgi:hypothetical protein